jgi:hypothetical protein
MRAATEAIGWLRITYDGIQYQTVGRVPLAGRCGSGTLGALSRLCLARIIEDGGRHPSLSVDTM